MTAVMGLLLPADERDVAVVDVIPTWSGIAALLGAHEVDGSDCRVPGVRLVYAVDGGRRDANLHATALRSGRVLGDAVVLAWEVDDEGWGAFAGLSPECLVRVCDRIGVRAFTGTEDEVEDEPSLLRLIERGEA